MEHIIRIKTQEQCQQSPWLMTHPENVVSPRLRKKKWGARDGNIIFMISSVCSSI